MYASQLNRNDIFNRVQLSKVIPLDTPFRLGIDVSNGCNFSCVFCFQSIETKYLNEMGFKAELMKMETFKNLTEQLRAFPDKFKSITFGGIGEPLLHKKLPQMIRMVKNTNKSEKISVVTNGSLLNNTFSKALIDAGLDEIIISIEALSSERYFEITKHKLDFEQYVDNIRFLYENKKTCKIFAKIVDVAFVDDNNSESKFHKIFDNISDFAYVESIVPRYKHVDYSTINCTDNILSLEQKIRADICSLPFYSLSIFASGSVSPCCVDYCETIILGNINEISLKGIWQGESLKDFRLAQLRREANNPVCSGCKFTQHSGRMEDIIDENSDQLILKYDM